MKIVKNLKRSIAVLLSLLLILPAFVASPVCAATGITTFDYEGYSVAYNVVNAWAGNQSVEVRITNTGTESILNWALKYDAKGTVSGLWNALTLENSNTQYLIKNAGHNYEIAPNQSVNFGYNLAGETLPLPDDFALCAKRVDTAPQSYSTAFNMVEQWDTGFKAELVLTNLSPSPIEAWKLSFDGGFALTDLWNAKLLPAPGADTVSGDLEIPDTGSLPGEL